MFDLNTHEASSQHNHLANRAACKCRVGGRGSGCSFFRGHRPRLQPICGTLALRHANSSCERSLPVKRFPVALFVAGSVGIFAGVADAGLPPGWIMTVGTAHSHSVSPPFSQMLTCPAMIGPAAPAPKREPAGSFLSDPIVNFEGLHVGELPPATIAPSTVTPPTIAAPWGSIIMCRQLTLPWSSTTSPAMFWLAQSA